MTDQPAPAAVWPDEGRCAHFMPRAQIYRLLASGPERAAVTTPMTAEDRRAITQRTGARVRSLTTGQRGTVEGHHDDDSVYVRMGGAEAVERWWTDDLRVAPDAAEARGTK